MKEMMMKGKMEELERIQRRILERITNLEAEAEAEGCWEENEWSSSPSSRGTLERLSGILRSNGVNDFCFKLVPSDYYLRSLQDRRDLLSAASVHHLCKSIVLVNTQAQSHVIDCSNPYNSKYYLVVVQYTARFNAEMVKNYLYALNQAKVPKKKFNFRLAPEDISNKLTGFHHNAVTCIGMNTYIPVILDEAIVKLSPDFFWLGGGEVYLKMGIRTPEFIQFVKPFIFSCSTA